MATDTEMLRFVAELGLTQEDASSYYEDSRCWSFRLEHAAEKIQKKIDEAVAAERDRMLERLLGGRSDRG